jgi:hypothetical protein
MIFLYERESGTLFSLSMAKLLLLELRLSCEGRYYLKLDEVVKESMELVREEARCLSRGVSSRYCSGFADHLRFNTFADS